MSAISRPSSLWKNDYYDYMMNIMVPRHTISVSHSQKTQQADWDKKIKRAKLTIYLGSCVCVCASVWVGG